MPQRMRVEGGVGLGAAGAGRGPGDGMGGTGRRRRTDGARGARRGGAAGGSSGVWLLGGVVAVIAVLVVVGLVTRRGGGGGSPLDGRPVAPSVLADVAGVPGAVLDAAGIRGAPLPWGGASAVWRGAGGRVVVYYYGAEYCPYCAASRWALVAALARFGTWSGLEYMTSSTTDVDPATPTFTFVHASYHSPYVEFLSVESTTNQGPQYPLQRPSPQEAAVLQRFGNTPYVPSAVAGTIPFIDVGNRFIWSTLVDPALLHGQSWSAIAAAVHAGRGAVGQAVLAAANVLTAGVCALDGQRPAAVCSAPPVRAAERLLPPPQHGSQPVGGGTAL
jgi:hypothetical protein